MAAEYLLEGEHVEKVTGSHQPAQFFRGVVIDEVVNGYQYDPQGVWTNYTYAHDSLQSVVGLSGHEGATIQTTQYAPFGDELDGAGASCSVLKYTGRERDAESGLYYYRARYYDPELGRFLTEDPLGFLAGINFYSYVENNPLNNNDPTGFFTVTASADIHIPAWATWIAEKAGFGEVPIGGIEVGVGVSFPFFDGAEFDAGGFFTAQVPGVDVGLGKGSINLGVLPNSSFSDLAGKDFTISATGAGFNFGASFNDSSTSFLPDSIQIGAGLGVNVGTTLDLTNVFSAKNGFISFDGAGGGFLLYPNKPNLNALESVYQK